MKRLWRLVLSCFAMLFACLCIGTHVSKAANVETDPLVLKKLEAFQDWKFGFIIHWGPYVQWGCSASWPLIESKDWCRPANLPAWVERGRNMARFAADYEKLKETFNPRHFDPDAWAAIAKRAGMKYVVFTTKHHDGFCMFDTKQTDYRITSASCPFHTNPKANVAKAVFDAFRKEGLGIGAYFSKPDWHCPDYWDPARPHKEVFPNYNLTKEPERWTRFEKFMTDQIEEIVTGYGPIDLLWLDGAAVNPPKRVVNMDAIAAMARKHQPGLIMVDRGACTRHENYRTPEMMVPKTALRAPWETCITLGNTWSYKPKDNCKTSRQLVHMLVDVVAKGGNLLLGFGPDADGRLPEEHVKRLDAMGRWLNVNGEAIYGTRAVTPYKTDRVWMTKKGSTIYLIHLPEKDVTSLPATLSVPMIVGGKSVKMLGTKKGVEASFDSKKGLTINIPQDIRENPPCEHAWTFVVSEARMASPVPPTR